MVWDKVLYYGRESGGDQKNIYWERNTQKPIEPQMDWCKKHRQTTCGWSQLTYHLFQNFDPLHNFPFL